MTNAMTETNDDKAGWEVEGFIARLTQRNDTNSERLVLEAVSHLRAFSRDCDGLRESNSELRADNERLRAALQWYADGDTWCKDVGGYGSAIHQDGGKVARRALEPKP